MPGTKALAAAAALLSVTGVPQDVLASAPVGVWVKVDKVIYAPDATNPSEVQVHGALMLYDGNYEALRPYPGYTSPAHGYTYYRCPEGQAEICRQEWSDIEANIVAPDTVCVGFGMESLPTGTLRAVGQPPTHPDLYPIQSGVSPGFSPCRAIANYLAEQGSTGGSAGSPNLGGSAGAPSAGGSDANRGGMTVTPGGVDSGGKPASGAPSSNSGQAGTTTSRAGAGAERATMDPTTDISACSLNEASGIAPRFGLGVAVGALGLALLRRRRQKSTPTRGRSSALAPQPALPDVSTDACPEESGTHSRQ